MLDRLGIGAALVIVSLFIAMAIDAWTDDPQTVRYSDATVWVGATGFVFLVSLAAFWDARTEFRLRGFRDYLAWLLVFLGTCFVLLGIILLKSIPQNWSLYD